jgi:L,D-transpeptidase catalytic domain
MKSQRSTWKQPAQRWVISLGLALVTFAALATPAYADDDNDDDNNTGTDQNSVAAAMAAPLVAGTPCTITARACVDLDSQRAWLFSDGAIVRGPVKVASGGNGKATPIGHSLRVYRKDATHKSLESRLKNGQPAPMPWSVFFADGGIAFHSGSPSRSSSGCIHLNDPDARAWFNYMAIGDQVQVVKASQELPRHKGQPAVSKKPGQIDPLRGLHDDSAPAPDSNSDGDDGDDDSDDSRDGG